MKSAKEILDIAKKTLIMESEAITKVIKLLDENFVNSVKHIYESKGRVIVTGIGKSANIANKIVATLNSTGTSAMFMHAADAVHGDLGMVQDNDTVICISKSGNSPEIKVLVPIIKTGKNKLIAITGNMGSTLAEFSDFVIDTTVTEEACPNNLAPTTSTTVQLAVGDALAMALLHCREFTSVDFARYHPGGALGKKLYLKAADLAVIHERPILRTSNTLKEAVLEISSKRLGAAAVMDKDTIIGIVTDGDIRRAISKRIEFETGLVKDFMGNAPKIVEGDTLAIETAQIMRNFNISQVIVVSNNEYIGMIHLHDLLKEGII